MIYLYERGVLMIFLDYCDDLKPILITAKNVVNLIKFGIPIILILFGMIDLGKAVMAGKEDEMKKAQQTLLKRFIYAAAVFFVVTLVTFVMGILPTSDRSGLNCWQSVTGGTNSGSGDSVEG